MKRFIQRAIIDSAKSKDRKDFTRILVTALAQPEIVLARLWMTDDTGDLILAASAGSPAGGGSYSRTDGEFRRIPLGSGKIGQIAETRTAFVVQAIRGDEEWLANPGWIARQGVRAFAGYPLMSDLIVSGVLAVFCRITLSDAALEDFRFLADYAGARLSRPPSLPPTSVSDPTPSPSTSHRPAAANPLTRAELRALEKRAIEAALVRTRGRVFGPNGAAVLLQMKPTTLASRIKALAIRMR